MSADLNTPPASATASADASARLMFWNNLKNVANKIHAASNNDEIMLELTSDICSLFNAERLTIWVIGEDKQSIVSKVKTGLNSFKNLKLPIAEHTIAGYVAFGKKMLNIKDCYDESELKAINPNLRFLQDVDKHTGYRTKQWLAVPVLDGEDLIGVIQIINNKAGVPFTALMEEGMSQLAQTLAIALRQRQKPQVFKTKYDFLVSDAVISLAELDLAARSARKKSVDVEQVLIEEFQVKLPAIGQALSKFFGVPYEPFKPVRMKPPELLRNLKREYVEQNQWVPIDDSREGVVVLCLDPERIKSSRIVQNVYPNSKLVYRVTTQREFKETLDIFFRPEIVDAGDTGDLRAGLEDEKKPGGESTVDNLTHATENETVKLVKELVNKIIIDAKNQGASYILIASYPGKGNTEIRFRKDESLAPYIEVPSSYRNAVVTRIKIMCDLDILEKRRPQDGKIEFKRFGPLDIELRVATIPIQGGVEDIVMRILAAGEE